MCAPVISGHAPLAVIAAATAATGRPSCATTIRHIGARPVPNQVVTASSTRDGNHVTYIARPAGAQIAGIDSVGSPWIATNPATPTTYHHAASHQRRGMYASAGPTTRINTAAAPRPSGSTGTA